jgi:DNA-binding beta-propeller fold protein YncE
MRVILKSQIFLLPLWLCILLGNAYAQPDSTQEVYEYVLEWGRKGSDTAQFNGPCGICLDDSGYVYVTDRWNNRVQKFDRNGGFILTWGRLGNGQGEFNDPTYITSDRSGRIYVSDASNYRIQVFDGRGGYLRQWSGIIIGICFGPSGKLYAARGADSLVVLDTLGNYIRGWGNGAPWWYPCAVTVDDSEHIYVSQTGVDSNYIQKFDSLGTPLLKWGGWGSGNGQFAYDYGLAIGDSGKVFATDCPGPGGSAHRVQKFSSGGRFITAWGTLGTGPGEFDVPYGVAVDREGYVYVTDASLYPSNNRVQKFRKTVVGVETSKKNRILRKNLSLWVQSPVRKELKVRYSLPQEGKVKIELYDLSGRKVRSLIDEVQGPGEHELRSNLSLPAGVYFLVLESPSGREVAKVVQIR